MTISPIQNVLSRLKSVKSRGNGFEALCPAHEDQRASLGIDEGQDGRVLMKCHAGCKIENIVAAMGLQMRDLFPDKPGQGRVVSSYYYRDSEGGLLFQVCRTADKHFFQRRPGNNGNWINGLGGIKPVLYRLPELLKAIRHGETVFIPEGEKDCDNLVHLGLAATTNPMGAGKWRDHYNKWFKRANVVVLPDNDQAGEKHALVIARNLRSLVKSIKVLRLPNLKEKQDVTDWINNGGNREELLRLVREAPEWEQGTGGCKNKETVRGENRKIRQASFFVVENTLHEQICTSGKSLFLAFDTATGETKTIHSVELEGESIEPLGGQDVELGAVKLPSGVEEYGDILTLLDEVKAHIHHYLDVSPSYLKFAAYYVLLSWLYDRFHTLPYLRALGDTGCGKSRFLDVIGGLCYKSISASGCVTPAPIYRMLRKWGGTLILDEADMKNSDEYSEVVTILNCGFEQGRPVIRALKDNPDKIQVLPVYGPKVFATRQRFKDVALEARCLTEIMRETDRGDIPPVLGKKFFEDQQKFRNKLLLFRLRNFLQVDPEAGANLALGGVEPRLKQVSEAFISLFANEHEVLESFREFIHCHQRELVEQRAATKVGHVVGALFELLDGCDGYKVSRVTTPMGESVIVVTPGDLGQKVGIAHQAVGQILKNLGLRTYPVKIEGKTKRCIIYDESKFNKLRKRYIPEEPESVLSTITLGTNETDVTGEQIPEEVF